MFESRLLCVHFLLRTVHVHFFFFPHLYSMLSYKENTIYLCILLLMDTGLFQFRSITRDVTLVHTPLLFMYLEVELLSPGECSALVDSAILSSIVTAFL